MAKKKPAKKKRKQEPESDFYIPIALPDFVDKNKYLHKKKGFVPQDMEVKHKTEKVDTKHGDFEINLD